MCGGGGMGGGKTTAGVLSLYLHQLDSTTNCLLYFARDCAVASHVVTCRFKRPTESARGHAIENNVWKRDTGAEAAHCGVDIDF